MRLILAGSICIWSIFAIVLLIFYPISKKRAYEIRDDLEKRRGDRESLVAASRHEGQRSGCRSANAPRNRCVDRQ